MDMVDSVSVAIFQALAGEPNCLISRIGADKAARAAIAAMREPTEGMTDEGWLAISIRHPDQSDMPRGVETEAWHYMIDAALGEGK